jgi:hypothetical protein
MKGGDLMLGDLWMKAGQRWRYSSCLGDVHTLFYLYGRVERIALEIWSEVK